MEGVEGVATHTTFYNGNIIIKCCQGLPAKTPTIFDINLGCLLSMAEPVAAGGEGTVVEGAAEEPAPQNTWKSMAWRYVCTLHETV